MYMHYNNGHLPLLLLGWEFNAQMSLFIGPLVFPLAFSINGLAIHCSGGAHEISCLCALACYQRREKVLDDLASFKASAMELFFCHRDWWKPAGNPTSVHINVNTRLICLFVNWFLWCLHCHQTPEFRFLYTMCVCPLSAFGTVVWIVN